jgi:hypothetical protein
MKPAFRSFFKLLFQFSILQCPLVHLFSTGIVWFNARPARIATRGSNQQQQTIFHQLDARVSVLK